MSFKNSQTSFPSARVSEGAKIHDLNRDRCAATRQQRESMDTAPHGCAEEAAHGESKHVHANPKRQKRKRNANKEREREGGEREGVR